MVIAAAEGSKLKVETAKSGRKHQQMGERAGAEVAAAGRMNIRWVPREGGGKK